MFDLTSRISLRNVPKWHKDLNRITAAIPVVLVGSKADDPDRKVNGEDLQNIPYFAVSSQTCENIEKPILRLLRDLVGDPSLKLEPFPQDYEPFVHYSREEVLLCEQAESIELEWKRHQQAGWRSSRDLE
jgi:GTP-binding nuclear protein Ran